jgi:hypothetical protein
MTTCQLAGRTPGGRFAPGVSGNPTGRPKGSRNKASVFAEAMRDGEAVELARRCLDEAQEGNSVSLRFALGRIEPARRGRPVESRVSIGCSEVAPDGGRTPPRRHRRRRGTARRL